MPSGDEPQRSDSLFEIRPQRLAGSMKVLLGMSLVLIALTIAAGIGAGDPLVILLVIGFALFSLFLARRPRLRVIAYDDRLVVHNWMNRWTVMRRDVVDFCVATPSIRTAIRQSSARGPVVHVVKRDGLQAPLQVTARKVPDDSLADDLARLREWLRSADQ